MTSAHKSSSSSLSRWADVDAAVKVAVREERVASVGGRGGPGARGGRGAKGGLLGEGLGGGLGGGGHGRKLGGDGDGGLGWGEGKGLGNG
eukprot:CAMPEP_0119110070 /NCGR_PEP_ID=MMETSP1180-20130426/26504_1 /TAXON_ID=3052 ORGANISM="Chlamydomonas cf sp, Strain CCMP681" /NCGR_SAMPLE_ID=MMETSP1180 /ASSEMBLY_ACC=CAM_ASM_000741 /LENGTH=89 /DNA_ID=CAMNT_0007096189 /DNA_START=3 /DNA_END=268 /DNA_ORIENTATION=-